MKVLFFGVLAECTGKQEIELSDFSDTESLKAYIELYHPDIQKYSYQISVNQNLISGNEKLQNSDEIAFLPPFAGG